MYPEKGTSGKEAGKQEGEKGGISLAEKGQKIKEFRR